MKKKSTNRTCQSSENLREGWGGSGKEKMLIWHTNLVGDTPNSKENLSKSVNFTVHRKALETESSS